MSDAIKNEGYTLKSNCCCTVFKCTGDKEHCLHFKAKETDKNCCEFFEPSLRCCVNIYATKLDCEKTLQRIKSSIKKLELE